MLSLEEQKRIVEAINHKIPTLRCPMCQENTFVLAEGYFNPALQTNLQTVSLGGRSIPTIPIICKNCGFVSQHALGVLGLLPSEEKTKNAIK